VNRKSPSAIFVLSLLALANLRAQYVEVHATIDVVSWFHQEETGLALKTPRSFFVRCVVGTNGWYIENHARTNPVENVWFTNGKIIRQIAYDTNAMTEDFAFSTGRRGYRTANIANVEDGYPAADLFVNLPWFAFCSGPYLKRPGRSVPLPAPAANQAAFGFTDETVIFKDALGLPERVTLRTSKGQTKCEYRVQQSTNVFGWNFPLAFTVVQNEPGPFDVWRKQLTASGRVVRIRRAAKPELPEDIQARLQLLERYPSRRR